MKQNFLHDDFEDFLKQNADQCRIIPSVRLWNTISKQMAYKRSRLSIALSLALLFSSLLASFPTNHYNHATVSSKIAVIPGNKPFAPGTIKQVNSAAIVPVQLSATNSYSIKNTVTKNTAVPAISLLSSSPADLFEAVETLPYPNLNNFDREPSLLSSFKLTTVPALNIASENNTAAHIVKAKESKHKMAFQFVFTPTVSYRKLSENKQAIAVSNGYLSFTGVNPVVSQKPGMGLELALLGKRSVSRNVKLFSGLQFNMTHYEVKAVNSMPEFATIALRNGYTYNYVNTISSYRNSNAVNANWLQNLYFQLSVPVGIEATVFGNNHTKVGVAGTVQPSYVMADQSYLLSTNYKNYVQAPWLVRRINVNTSLATFIAYSSGKLNWQVGPQVRYQLLSSFKTKYPIKENLFDYGLRVGVSLAK